MSSAQEPDRYEIRVKGHLTDRWGAWFDGMTLSRGTDGTTVLDGPVVDQSALHGLLRKVSDLGLPLVSIAFVMAVAAPPAARSALSAGESAASASQNLRGKSSKNRNSRLTQARVALRGMRVASHVVDDGNTCASHSHGEVQAFFQKNPCVALHREMYVLDDPHGDEKVLVAYASVEMKDGDQARCLQEVLDKNGSGNVTELSRERGAYRSVRYDDAVFASERDGTVVVNAQAKFVQGMFRRSDLELIAHDAIR